MLCTDCKGSGIYTGFMAREACKLCGGSGNIAVTESKAGDSAVSVMDAECCRSRLAPEYVHFKWSDLTLISRVCLAASKWIYVTDQPTSSGLPIRRNFIRYDNKMVQLDRALNTAMSLKNVYALYECIQRAKKEDVSDAVYKLVWTRR